MPEDEFDSLFNDLEGSAFGEILKVRSKKANGKKLTKEERILYNNTKLKLTENEEVELEKMIEKNDIAKDRAYKIIAEHKKNLQLNKK